MEYKKEKYYKSNLHCQFWDLLWWFLLCNAKSLIVPGREKPWEQRSALGWSFPAGHGGRAPEQFSTEGYLKTPRNWGFLLENNPNPPGEGWTWVSASLGQQKKGSSCIILGLPGGFVNSLLAPRLVLVALRLEHRFLALVFGDYCLQFPSDRCLKEQYWAGEGGGKEKKASLGYLCAVVWATKRSVRQRKRPHETALGVALTGIKAPSTTLGKGERAGKWVLFQFSAFLQRSDSFIYSISPTLAVMSI